MFKEKAYSDYQTFFFCFLDWAQRIGLGFELQRAEFTLNDLQQPTQATVRIDGHQEPNWHFEIHSIEEHNHTISVAYGPIEDSIGPVRASLRYPGPNRPSANFGIPSRIDFQELSIQDLLEIR